MCGGPHPGGWSGFVYCRRGFCCGAGADIDSCTFRREGEGCCVADTSIFSCYEEGLSLERGEGGGLESHDEAASQRGCRWEEVC